MSAAAAEEGTRELSWRRRREGRQTNWRARTSWRRGCHFRRRRGHCQAQSVAAGPQLQPRHRPPRLGRSSSTKRTTRRRRSGDSPARVKALYEEKLPSMAGVDVCCHTSLIPNARARGVSTITHLAEDASNANSSRTQCPCPMIGACAMTALIGTRPAVAANHYAYWLSNARILSQYGHATEILNVVAGSLALHFPLYPPAALSGLYATPNVANLTSNISSEEEEYTR
mmetsp:Transcript_26833/g.64375  ORF Transcript_26833/g.64375 Transcript_26833/m.64375 type:complete len:228 (-) Transcript_26833:243-926(-)